MKTTPTLNLPPAPLRLTQRNGQTCVFDELRRRYIKVTPEEWVRQHFVHFLIGHLGYPQGLLANEVSLSLNQTTKRCDTVLYDLQARPRMIVEYKAPHIELTQKVFDQISRYNIVLRVPYLIVSNGIQHYCCRIHYELGRYEFLPEIPAYANL
ncbi:MAG: type I restriction enzyme HsdR N-terminal domain-containing protein [Bacteroidaceae bacterium]|nr:type I restriction enzyme HsdR N-terminal domain-containing protein [Bacteroidaceae bacterium]